MSGGEPARANRQMTLEERAGLVAALDHDVRQSRHSIEMGLRTLRMLTTDIAVRSAGRREIDELVQRSKTEQASLRAAIKQVTDTMEDLFDAIRFEFEERPPRLRTLYASDLIERVIDSNRGIAGSARVVGIPSRMKFISDERWIERILNNLVGNAICHSNGSRISVGVRPCGKGLVFEVRDNGRGMSVEEVARVFEPLRIPEVSPIRSSAARSGLGLYNVRLFTERLGGVVRCSSRLGQGTLFRVELPGPVGMADWRKPCSKVETSGVPLALNKLVAVLDDDPLALRATERALEAIGVEVYADEDPLRWLNVVTELQRAPDLVLLDFHLGSQDCSLHLDIVRRRWNGKIKVLILTGDPDSAGVTEMAHFAPVLRKPLSDEKFSFITDVLIGRRVLPTDGLL